MEAQMPLLPEPDRNGCRPVAESGRVNIAQQLIADCQKAGLSQAKLANRAGICQEIVPRIESGKVASTVKLM